jgi:hypothetical protein
MRMGRKGFGLGRRRGSGLGERFVKMCIGSFWRKE